MEKPWNGQTPWFDCINEFTDKEGNTFLDIWFVFDDPSKVFGIAWDDLGYESLEDYEENCFECLIIRYNPESETWEPRHLIDTEHCTDDCPIYGLTEEETAEINESIRLLKESGELYSGKNRV